MVKEIKIEDFNYDLPDERIPRHPLRKRAACKLLLARPDGIISHRRFADLPGLLPTGSMLICNDTRVINARITFHKPTGSRIEVFLLEPLDPADYVLTFQTRSKCIWNCLVGNLKRWKNGNLSIEINPEGTDSPVILSATRLHPTEGNAHAIEFSWDNPDVTFASVVEAAGFIPIPPYLKRESEQSDASDYQTVYADAKGSVAAPTAGLHFTPEVFADLEAHNIPVGKLTLHVGAGTFQPVKSENIGGHPMHTETFSVSRQLISKLIAQKSGNHPIVAVGTTSVRTLESLPYIGAAIMRCDDNLHVGQWEAYDPEARSIDTVAALQAIADYLDCNGESTLTASTAIMIAPGFNWRMVDVMVTNFHQPQSTLLLLVSSFLGEKDGKPRWREIYNEALREDYRFLSYGDACLFFPKADPVISLPASKSIGARFLVASYFAGNLKDCNRFDDCDDLQAIQTALLSLDRDKSNGDTELKIDVHASGTAFRFFVASTASSPGKIAVVTGTPRLCSRPMAPMLGVLTKAGAEIEALGEGGTGPFRITGRRLKGGDFEIRGDVSSQFVSALMLAAPTWEGGMRLRFTTPLVSRPYVEMTASIMRRFGISVCLEDECVSVEPGCYLTPQGFNVEPDWSAAGFFYEAASLRNHPLRIAGLAKPEESLQGDSATATFFDLLGIGSTFQSGYVEIKRLQDSPEDYEADLSHNPDLAPALAVACALNGIRFLFSGVRNLRVKECDRLAAIKAELAKLGFDITVGDDTLQWDGTSILPDPDSVITTYDDHRIAMAFAMVALKTGSIRIAHPEVVDKSFADFWEKLPQLGLTCTRKDEIMTVTRHEIP